MYAVKGLYHLHKKSVKRAPQTTFTKWFLNEQLKFSKIQTSRIWQKFNDKTEPFYLQGFKFKTQLISNKTEMNLKQTKKK